MALFGGGRGKDADGLIKKIEARNFRGPGEKRAMIEQLATMEIRPDVLARLMTASDADLSRMAVNRVAELKDPGSVELMLGALQRLPRGRWKPVLKAIHGCGVTTLGAKLDDMMRSQRNEVRDAALEVVASSDDWTRHLSIVKMALKDQDPGLRTRAVALLGSRVEEHGVRQLLQDLLYSSDDVVRGAAIETFSRRPHPDVIEDFFDLLPNEQPKQQELIIRGIKKLLAAEGTVSEEVQDRILPLLAAEDERIRQAAASMLGSIPDKLYVLRRFFVYAKGIAFWLRDRAFTAVCAVSDNVVDAILTLLEDHDLDVVVGATTMAGNSRDPRVIEGLWGVLDREDLDWWVKVPALEHLAKFQHPTVERILVEKLQDEDLRTAALASLGERGNPNMLPHILEFLGNERRTVRRTALRALEGFREPIVQTALERVARTERDEECRYAALEMLDALGPNGAAVAQAVRASIKKPETRADEAIVLEMQRKDLD